MPRRRREIFENTLYDNDFLITKLQGMARRRLENCCTNVQEIGSTCKGVPIGRTMVLLNYALRCRAAGAKFLKTASIVTIFL